MKYEYIDVPSMNRKKVTTNPISPKEQVKQILDGFDFRLVNRVCKLLRLKHSFCGEPAKILSEGNLKNLARGLLEEVIVKDREVFETVEECEYGLVASYDGTTVNLDYVLASA